MATQQKKTITKRRASTGPAVVINQRVDMVPVGLLFQHPRNPRKGNVEELRALIRENGFYGTIIAQVSTSFILAGWHRFEAAKAEGITAVPVVWLDVDDKKALKIVLADNRSSDLSGYNSEALEDALRELADSDDLEGTGYDQEFLDSLDAEDEPELKKLDVTKPPTMTWVLVGIPTVRFGEINELVEKIAQVDEIICEVVANNADGQ